MSVFQKRKPPINISGSRPSLHNGQLLVSSGNPSLDFILGGGLQIGSMLLVEEDKYVTYSRSILKYFLAEGAVHRHRMFLATLDEDPNELIKKIPVPSQHQSAANTDQSDNDDMRIAWRYNTLPKIDAEQKTIVGHHFDLTRPITDAILKELDIFCYQEEAESDVNAYNLFSNQIFGSILLSLKNQLKEFNINENEPKNLFRICFQSLGSPIWQSDNYNQDICLFLTILKALIRHNLAVCLITMPCHLLQYYDNHLIDRIRNLVDYSVELESFAGSDRETNPIFKEYNGLLHINRNIALNTLAPFVLETHDLAFKLRRKKFVIEKLHLPPELQESTSQPQPSNDIVPGISCATSTKHLLEF